MRFDWQRVAGAMAVLAVMALAVVACEDGTGVNNNGGEDDDTVIEVQVREDGSGRVGVTVQLFASGSETAQSTRQTGTGGVASFGDLDAGTYDVEIEVPEEVELEEGETARKSVTVADGETEEVRFDLVGDGEPPADIVQISASGTSFSQAEVTITVGTTVRWVNQGTMAHTVTPREHNEWSRATLNSAGSTFEHTFETAGTFPYYCEPHESQGMTGTITVTQ